MFSKMRISWIFTSSFLVMFTFVQSSLIHFTVNVGDPVTFKCNQMCRGPVEWTKVASGRLVIADCDANWICSYGDAVKNRVMVSNGQNPSLIFSSTVYNDMGAYECKCGGKPICDVKLKVLVSITVTANVLDQVTLPCFWNTFKDTTDFQWERDNKLVLHYQNEKLTTGEGFDENFSFSKDGYKDGNLTLTINQVQQSDAGLYRCHINEKWEEGYPHSYILIVKEKPNDEETNMPVQNAYSCYGTWIGLFGITISFVIALLVCFGMRRCKITSCKTSNTKHLQDVPIRSLPNQEIAVTLENGEPDSLNPRPRAGLRSVDRLSRRMSASLQNAARNSENRENEREGLIEEEQHQ